MGYRAPVRTQYAEAIPNQTITSLTFVDMDTLTVTVRRKQVVTIWVSIGISANSGGALDEGEFQVIDEASSVPCIARFMGSTGVGTGSLWMVGQLVVEPGVAKTIKLQGRVITSGDDVRTNSGGFGQGYLFAWVSDS